MATVTESKKFKTLIFKEEFKPLVKTRKESDEQLKKQLHGFTVMATSEDVDLQRFEDVTASMAIEPRDGNLVVVERDGNYFIERYPVANSNFVATVLSTSITFR